MKNTILPFLFFLFFQNTYSQNILYPQVWFNKKEAVQKLEIGKTTITGEAFTRETAGVAAKYKPPKGTKVLLFPVTDYIKEYLSMKKSNPQVAIVMTEEAFAHRIEALTDENGNFVFKQMKPGKYLIMCNILFAGTGVAVRESGRTHYYNGYGYAGSTPTYESYMYNYDGDHFLSKYVEIEEGEKVVEANLKPKFFSHLKGNGSIKNSPIVTLLSSSTCGRSNNLMHGKCTEYHPNGKPKIVAKWKEGAQHGETLEYYDTGEVYWKGIFKNGKLHGKSEYYSKDGKISKTENYTKGILTD